MTLRPAHALPPLLCLGLLAPLAACAAADRTTHVAEALRHAGEVSIELAELRAAGDESFAALDVDGDGMITPTEFENSGPVPGMFAGAAPFVFVHDGVEEFDVDIDVEVATETLHTRSFRFEVGTDDATAFAEMDADGDGMLSLEEYENRSNRFPIPHEEIEVDFDGVAEAFDGFDENDDGVITRDEWPSPDRHLAALDADGDGIVDFEELTAREGRREFHFIREYEQQ